jgi:hypothetical protein
VGLFRWGHPCRIESRGGTLLAEPRRADASGKTERDVVAELIPDGQFTSDGVDLVGRAVKDDLVSGAEGQAERVTAPADSGKLGQGGMDLRVESGEPSTGLEDEPHTALHAKSNLEEADRAEGGGSTLDTEAEATESKGPFERISAVRGRRNFLDHGSHHVGSVAGVRVLRHPVPAAESQGHLLAFASAGDVESLRPTKARSLVGLNPVVCFRLTGQAGEGHEAQTKPHDNSGDLAHCFPPSSPENSSPPRHAGKPRDGAV